MDRSKTKELLETIENQKEQISRYETRLRDIVHAYKSLLKEKEALEASVKVLSAASKSKSERSSNKATAKEAESKKVKDGEDGEDRDEESKPEEDVRERKDSANDGSWEEMQQQLATLSSSLATLTAEKSKMEASFQADKKKIRQETEEMVEKLTSDKEALEETVRTMESQLTEAKNRLRSQQQEREQEQVDHAVMLRELQTLLGQERTGKERLDQKIEELEERLAQANAEPDRTHIYEEQIKKLTIELESVQRKLIAAHEEAAKPPPLLLQLQKDMAEMKAQHRIQVELEQQKSREAEERLNQARAMEEERVTALEAKLAELSEVVGSYDRVRQQDQIAIQKLKERVTQLDLENTALARAANSRTIQNVEELNDPAEIKETILKLKGLLKLANEQSEKPVDIDDIGNLDDETSREQSPDHKACQQELKQLKEEFERYKVRAQTVLKNRNVKDTTNNKEIEELQAQINGYKERVSILRQQLDDEEKKCEDVTKEMEDQLANQKEHHKKTLAQADGEFKQKISDLEHQVGKQRDRTMALLVDKDKEIDYLKQQIYQFTGRTFGDDRQNNRQTSLDSDVFTSEDANPEEHSGQDTEHMVSQLISNPATQLAASSGTSLLHYAEEQARKEVELATVKKQKQQLETALRQLQDKHSSSNQKHAEEIDSLQEEVERWKRNRSREGTNLEYLKNVVLNYLLTDSVSGKKRMFNAISTILHFSPKEKDSVLRKTSSAWWSGY